MCGLHSHNITVTVMNKFLKHQDNKSSFFFITKIGIISSGLLMVQNLTAQKWSGLVSPQYDRVQMNQLSIGFQVLYSWHVQILTLQVYWHMQCSSKITASESKGNSKDLPKHFLAFLPTAVINICRSRLWHPLVCSAVQLLKAISRDAQDSGTIWCHAASLQVIHFLKLTPVWHSRGTPRQALCPFFYNVYSITAALCSRVPNCATPSSDSCRLKLPSGFQTCI